MERPRGQRSIPIAQFHRLPGDTQTYVQVLARLGEKVVEVVAAKGIGAIGIVDAAAVVANAIFHATGKRIHNLPITPNKLL